MNDTTSPTQTNQATEQKSAISDYLDQPRAKKKEHILLAFGEGLDPELKILIHRSLKGQFKQHTLVTPQTAKDMLRNIGKKISFLIVDDSFAEWNLFEPIIIKLKENQLDSGIPTIFLTNDCVNLINHYHKHLHIYQEQDDYIEYPKLGKRELLATIFQLCKQDTKRRSRRYTINLPVQFSSINLQGKLKGEVIDLSMHGAMLKNSGDLLFRPGDQLQVSFNVSQIIENYVGEFMSISALVRRVGIAGIQAGISWEYMTETKIKQLSAFLHHHAQKDILMKQRMRRNPKNP